MIFAKVDVQEQETLSSEMKAHTMQKCGSQAATRQKTHDVGLTNYVRFSSNCYLPSAKSWLSSTDKL